MKLYVTCTNLETCSNVEVQEMQYDESFEIVTTCSVCRDYAIITTEPILEIAISDDIYYLNNLIILDEIAKNINLYEKEKKGKNNERNQKESDLDNKQ